MNGAQKFYDIITNYRLPADTLVPDVAGRESVEVAWEMAYAAKQIIDPALNLLHALDHDVLVPVVCSELDMAATDMITEVAPCESEPGFVTNPRGEGPVKTQCVVKYAPLHEKAYKANKAARQAMRIAKDAQRRGLTFEDAKQQWERRKAGAQIVDLALYRQSKVE